MSTFDGAWVTNDRQPKRVRERDAQMHGAAAMDDRTTFERLARAECCDDASGA